MMPLFRLVATVAQLVERIHGKDEVRGSIPRGGSEIHKRPYGRFCVEEPVREIVLEHCFVGIESRSHVAP